MNKPFRILSLDGGGLRGIIPVLILKEIERRSGKRIIDLFDMIAGTSTGGLIACGITVSDDGIHPKYTLQDIENVYTKRGNDIFPKKNFIERIINSVTCLKRPRFSEVGIDKVLTDMFEDRRITNCILPIFITTFDLYNNNALFFKSRHALCYPSKNALLKDVCRATSAAPTYLPAYKFNYDGKASVCVDGGVYINNPALAALVEISKHHNDYPYNFDCLSLEDIKILSLGTGHYSNDIARKKVESWGMLDWATNITDVMMQAVNQTTSYQVDELTKSGNFLRINVDIENEDFADMADSSDETRNYLISEVKKQVFGNATLMKQMDVLLKKCF